MAKGIYVGATGKKEQLVTGNIVPTSWTKVSDTQYISSDGVILQGVDSENTSSYPLKNVCDGNSSTAYRSGVGYSQRWVKLIFPQPTKITKMKIKIGMNSSSYFNKLTVYGEKTDGTSLILASTTNYSSSLVEYTLNNTDFYDTYILAVNTNKNNSNYVMFYEWQASEYTEYIELPDVVNIARKVKGVYVGINGVAKKIKKGYIGVNGVAKLFYESE